MMVMVLGETLSVEERKFRTQGICCTNITLSVAIISVLNFFSLIFSVSNTMATYELRDGAVSE
jgi:hypothetical protein